MNMISIASIVLVLLAAAATAAGGVGDPQVRTDHPWGEPDAREIPTGNGVRTRWVEFRPVQR